MYHIYWISVHWSWNLSSGVLANCWWNVFKPDIHIWFPCRFEQITWRIFYIKKINQLKQTSLNTQLTNFPWPLTKLQGKKIHIYSLDTTNIQFSNTPNENFVNLVNARVCAVTRLLTLLYAPSRARTRGEKTHGQKQPIITQIRAKANKSRCYTKAHSFSNDTF